MTRKFFISLALAGAALTGSGPAMAQSEAAAAHSTFHEPTAVAVTYGDLDLNSRDAAAAMLGRLQRAAMDACGVSDFSLEAYRWAAARSACVRRGVGRAVADLDAPMVTRLYEETHGRSEFSQNGAAL